MPEPRPSLFALAVACVLAGWFAGTSRLSVEAQRRPTVERVIPGKIDQRDCGYAIVELTGTDRGDILLDECTGNTWWYDSGWQQGSGYSGSFVRESEWKAIPREAVE